MVSGKHALTMRRGSLIMKYATLKVTVARIRIETLLITDGVPVHVVAAGCGHDPATLLRNYAKRTHKADTSAANVIGSISKGILGN